MIHSNRARRALLGTALLALACWTGADPAQAQPYGSRPSRIIVGFPPGGGTDLAARLIAPMLAERLAHPFIVENRVGAGGNIALEAIAKAPPDGHTFGVAASGMTINATLQQLRFDPVKDFAPITMLVNNPLVLFSNPAFPARDVRALVAMAKAQPGKIVYGSPGTGSAMHMAGTLLNLAAGIDLVHVAYKGNGPLVNDVLGGQVGVGFADVVSTLSFIKAGKLHALGVTGPKRTATAPDIPTLAETGMPGFSVLSWTGLVAPAKTPAEIVDRLSTHVRSILESHDVRERLLATGLEPTPMTPDQFAEVIRNDTARWAKVIKQAGIKPDN